MLLALVARETGQFVRTNTTGFPGTTSVRDERAAAAVARWFGATHRGGAFISDDFWRLLQGVVATVDDPIIDYATLPTFKMADWPPSSRRRC